MDSFNFDYYEQYISAVPPKDILDNVKNNQSMYPRVSQYDTVDKIFKRIAKIRAKQKDSKLTSTEKNRLENEYETLRGKHYVVEGMKDNKTCKGPEMYLKWLYCNTHDKPKTDFSSEEEYQDEQNELIAIYLSTRKYASLLSNKTD